VELGSRSEVAIEGVPKRPRRCRVGSARDERARAAVRPEGESRLEDYADMNDRERAEVRRHLPATLEELLARPLPPGYEMRRDGVYALGKSDTFVCTPLVLAGTYCNDEGIWVMVLAFEPPRPKHYSLIPEDARLDWIRRRLSGTSSRRRTSSTGTGGASGGIGGRSSAASAASRAEWRCRTTGTVGSSTCAAWSACAKFREATRNSRGPRLQFSLVPGRVSLGRARIERPIKPTRDQKGTRPCPERKPRPPSI
jgi:hypothetical protein